MSETLKKVATAICKSRSCEGAACCQWPGNAGRSLAECPVWRGGYDDAARDAIAAILPPPDTKAVFFEDVGITEKHLSDRERDAWQLVNGVNGADLKSISVSVEPRMVLVLCAAYRAYHRLKRETKP